MRRLLLSSLLLLTALCAMPTAAQFNGPASLSGGQEVNRTPTPTTDTALLFPALHDVQLITGDQLAFRVYGQPDYVPVVRISLDGNVLLPFLGTVHLGGLTVPQAEELVAQKLIDAGIYKNPQVTVQVTEGPNAVVTVIGEAHGVVPIQGSRPLLDVLTTVGGLPPTASHVLTINRAGTAQPIVVDLGSDPLRSQLANIPLFPGDTIVVSRIGIVYMVGAFKNPGVIPMNSYGPLTLMQATALSGGLAFEGKYDDLHLIRTVGEKRTVVKLDVKAVLYGKAPDPILQPGDIVFLPSSTLKASISNGSFGTILSVASLAIALGIR